MVIRMIIDPHRMQGINLVLPIIRTPYLQFKYSIVSINKLYVESVKIGSKYQKAKQK
ncbi:hypothetical protein MACH08_42080 [Oceanobacillus kimchii]|uniref:Uncharacterized protein n=1 Tax=Oceanobacillus kimchii TaxID=746691 RepID=A0ABQ5TNN9_9BACI|nr:hypothetical protein MACH08_42080 [Oceanobacillus kimchii]